MTVDAREKINIKVTEASDAQTIMARFVLNPVATSAQKCVSTRTANRFKRAVTNKQGRSKGPGQRKVDRGRSWVGFRMGEGVKSIWRGRVQKKGINEPLTATSKMEQTRLQASWVPTACRGHFQPKASQFSRAPANPTPSSHHSRLEDDFVQEAANTQHITKQHARAHTHNPRKYNTGTEGPTYALVDL